MVKHTQTICRQFADELFECVWPFCEIGAEGLDWIKQLIIHVATNKHLPVIWSSNMKS